MTLYGAGLHSIADDLATKDDGESWLDRVDVEEQALAYLAPHQAFRDYLVEHDAL